MYRGFPNYAPQGMDYVATEERPVPEDSELDVPTFSLSGWRRFAAIAFAVSPGIVYVLVIALHAVTQS